MYKNLMEEAEEMNGIELGDVEIVDGEELPEGDDDDDDEQKKNGSEMVKEKESGDTSKVGTNLQNHDVMEKV